MGPLHEGHFISLRIKYFSLTGNIVTSNDLMSIMFAADMYKDYLNCWKVLLWNPQPRKKNILVSYSYLVQARSELCSC